ncbi:hypothetical protein [Nocardia sp. NPDC059229]|uniref:hypothetical protein n=1 Tax=Nocardia sp. NPDC059229 TaxID=3346778 RepID=UPI0036C6FACA
MTDPRSTTELLDLVFRHNSPRGSDWIARPPQPWFCHFCDSQCTTRDFAPARFRWRLRGRYIVCSPDEWRHFAFQPLKLSVDAQHRIEAALREAAPEPGWAITWDTGRQQFRRVRGIPIDWRRLERRH